MKIKRFGLLLLLAGLLNGNNAWSAMYKWVDENGVTIYSQTPPPNGTASIVKPPPPPPAVDPEIVREKLNRQLQGFDDAEEDRELAREKEQKQAQKDGLYQSNCTRAHHNLTNLQGNPRKLMRTSDGKYERLTEERRQKLIAEAQRNISKYCR